MKLKYLLTLLTLNICLIAEAQKTFVSIKGNQFYINGKPTYEGRNWNGNKIEGLLMNSRMVQGVFDDLNVATRDTFAYADTKKWDADRNNNEFIAAMPLWKSYGLNCFSLNMQSGSPFGYGNFNFNNPGFNPDGSLHDGYMKRLDKILKRADELEMVVILGFFYMGQDQRMKDETAIKNAVTNMINWLHEKKYRNILIEINNETLGDFKHYDHAILLYTRVHELINLAKSIEKNGYRYIVSTSFPAKIVPTKNVVDASDYVLFHGNAQRTAEMFTNHIAKVKAVVGSRIMPIVINEDDNFAFETDTCHLNIALKNYISWGYFDYRKQGVTDLKEGYQTVPVDWGINSELKKSFFNKLKEITGEGQVNSKKKILYQENFETPLDTTKWFAELGTNHNSTVSVKNGTMEIDVDYGATVWFKKELKDAWMIEFDRTVPMKGGKNDRLADFNVFWQATDPHTGKLMGRDPKFANYDTLTLYYVGMGGHKNTTNRFRKYMGTSNKDVIQEYTDVAHLLEADKTYHCKIIFKKDTSYFYINDVLFFTYKDEKPLTHGYFGFRTLQSRHIIDNFKVFEIE